MERVTKEIVEKGGLLGIAVTLIGIGAALIEAKQYAVGIILAALGIALIFAREKVKESLRFGKSE